MPAVRRLAAILAADVAGYSRLMGADEEGTHEQLKAHRRELIDPKIAAHRGRVVKTTGDGMLVEFASTVDALRCAAAIQTDMAERNAAAPPERRIELRIGVHQGDVIVEDGDIFGDGVNIAARLEGLAMPGGVCVSARVQEDVAGKVDLAFADIGEQRLKNIARPVRAYRLLPKAPTPAVPTTAAEPSPRLSIVVLPFANLSSDPDQEYFADAITEDLTTDLSRIAGAFVIARNTAFTYKGKAADVQQIGRELGVRYLLEGSVRRAGEEVRINVQLVDAGSGAHLWADRVETDRRRLLAAETEITGRLARSLNLELIKDLDRRMDATGTIDPDARDLIMRGYALWYRPRATRNNVRAIRVFERALEIDPRSLDARVGIAKILVSNVTQAWTDTAEQDIARAEDLLLQVLEQDAGCALAHSTMGMVRREQNRLDESRFEFETAIAFDPNDTYAHIQLGWTLVWLSEIEAAVERCEKALRLSPRDPQLWGYHLPLGWCHLLLCEVEPAINRVLRSRALNPRLWFIHFSVAAAMGLGGRIDEAKTALTDMLKLKPEASSIAGCRRLRPWGNARYWELFDETAAAGLRRAGFPDR
jgi:adenylate cyclase